MKSAGQTDEDDMIAVQAAIALSEKHRQAVKAGIPQVVVIGGKLVLQDGCEVTTLKSLKDRKKLTIRNFRIKP